MGKCLICHRSTRRQFNSARPCCNKCEKTTSMAIQSPTLFSDSPGPAQIVALAAIRDAQKLNEEVAS